MQLTGRGGESHRGPAIFAGGIALGFGIGDIGEAQLSIIGLHFQLVTICYQLAALLGEAALGEPSNIFWRSDNPAVG
jgi:hypothetical protein